MKKILLWILITCMTPVVFAAETQKDYGKLCEELWGQHLILESFPVQEKCSINDQTMSLASFQDKYNQFVAGMMIHYVSEYKYSDATKWQNYLEFLAQDIQDMKVFQEAQITKEQKLKVEEFMKIQENLYNFMYLQETLWEKVTEKIEKILEQYEAKILENKKQALYQRMAKKLDEKVKEMEYFQMVAHFTPEGYQAFLFKMNVYKYMLLLVQGRME